MQIVFLRTSGSSPTPKRNVSTVPITRGPEVILSACGEYVVRAFEAVPTVPCVSFVLEEKTRPGRFSVERAEALGVPSGPLYSQLQAGEPVTIRGRTIRPEDVLGPPRRGRKIVYTGDT